MLAAQSCLAEAEPSSTNPSISCHPLFSLTTGPTVVLLSNCLVLIWVHIPQTGVRELVLGNKAAKDVTT